MSCHARVDPASLGLFPGGLDANFVRVIWQQMLKAVQAMHDERVSETIAQKTFKPDIATCARFQRTHDYVSGVSGA